MSSAKAKDFQRTIELLNKFSLTTIQFMNRFTASCEERLWHMSKTLSKVESQVALLEYKLDSIDAEGAGSGAAADKAAMGEGQQVPKAITNGPGLPPGVTAGPPGVHRPGGSGVPPPLPPGVSSSGTIPAMGAGGRQQPPPPPGMKQPPLPPGAAPAAGGAGGALMLMPPPNTALPPGFIPPPPPPPPSMSSGAVTIRNHAKLQGYFKMQDAGVPVAAIKTKMQIDGYDPSWFDTPDAPAPLAASNEQNKQSTLYDSD